jgi:cysteinyl-tRNA synthetase
VDNNKNGTNYAECKGKWNVRVVPDAIFSLIEERQVMRAAKRWDEADALRRRINAAGYQVEDTPQGSRIRIV